MKKIILLFIAIETSPIFVKLISSKGPYDDLLEKHPPVALDGDAHRARGNLHGFVDPQHDVEGFELGAELVLQRRFGVDPKPFGVRLENI